MSVQLLSRNKRDSRRRYILRTFLARVAGVHGVVRCTASYP